MIVYVPRVSRWPGVHSAGGHAVRAYERSVPWLGATVAPARGRMVRGGGSQEVLSVVPIPGNSGPRQIENLLLQMFPDDWLRTVAADVGFVQRQRKIDPVTLFWVLVLDFGVGVQRSLASLRRAYQTASVETLVPPAFYDRFHPRLLAFLRACLNRRIDERAQHPSLVLGEK